MLENERLYRALSTLSPLMRQGVQGLIENDTMESQSSRFAEELPLRFVILVGMNKQSRASIVEIYKEDERVYYQYYLDSAYRNAQEIMALPILERESVQRFLGIFEYCVRTKQYLKIEKIIGAINRSLVNFAKKEHALSTQKFMGRYLELTYLNEEELIVDEIDSLTVDSCLAFLAGVKQKGYLMDPDLANLLYIGWLNVVSHTLIHWDDLLKESAIRRVLRETQADLGLSNDELDKCQTFRDFTNLAMTKLDADDSDSPISIMLQAWKFTLTAINDGGLNTWVMEERTPFSKEIFWKVVTIFKSYHSYTGVTYRDLGVLLATEMMKICYMEAGELYLQQAKDERFVYLKEQEQLIAVKQEELAQAEQESTKRESKLQEAIKELKRDSKANQRTMKQHLDEKQAELIKVRDQNRALQSKLDDQQAIIEQQATLLALQQRIDETSLTFDEQIQFLKGKKLALFGGMKHAELQELLPNLKIFQELNKNIDASKHADAVFVNTSFFNHAFFYKVKAALKGTDVPVYYVSGTNTQRIIAMMYEQTMN